MHATLEAAVSVGRSVGLSVGRSVTFLKYGSNIHFKGTLGYLRVLKGTLGYLRVPQGRKGGGKGGKKKKS